MSNVRACCFVIIASLFTSEVSGVELTSRFVDGLDRPIRGVAVEVRYPKKGPDEKLKEIEWLKATSDQDGKVKIEYDETLVPTNETIRISVKKPGYSGFSTERLKPEQVLKKEFAPEDVHRIAGLTGEKQKSELQEILVGQLKEQARGGRHQSLEELIFFHANEMRGSLRELVADSKSGKAACSMLAFIGIPEDLKLITKNLPPPKRKLFEDRWAYFVACSLLSPETQEEWEFLRQCASDVYYDRWVDAGAIRTLKLIASPQSVDVLKQAPVQNPERKRLCDLAVEAIRKGPASLEDGDLEAAGKKVAQAISIGEWQFNSEPRFNKAEDMALIDCEFIDGRDLLVETATFHKIGSLWKLRGVRQTMQALLASPPDKNRFVGVWQGFSETQIEFARLELKEDATGLLAVSFLPDSVPDKYLVTKWAVKDQLELALKPADPATEPISLENLKLGVDVLPFVLRPLHGGDWSCQLKLFRDKSFQSRANATKEALDGIRK
jgi:hypothetical protein